MSRMAQTIGAVLAIVSLAACDGKPEQKKPVAKFAVGSLVVAKISGSRGMVVESRCWASDPYCYYDVRFGALQMKTDTHLLSSDGPITLSPLALVKYLREYELDAAQ